MLVDHTNTGSHGIARASKVHCFVIEKHLATVWIVKTIDDVHERGLASSIFTKKCVHLSWLHNQIDGIVCCEVSELFSDAA